MDTSGLDPKCVRSLNGYRSTLHLLSVVPDQNVFRITLRAVKLWAKRQGLYSNSLGYLGGFSWAVLVAKACMEYPDVREGSELVMKFFELFANWKWPQPVILNDYEKTDKEMAEKLKQLPPSSSIAQQHHWSSWNPNKNPLDKNQVKIWFQL